MFYTNIDHYNYEVKDNEYKPIELNDCFICYENKMEDDFETIQLNTQKYYYKKCLCNGWVHQKCLYKWYDKSNKCPICRISITKTPQISSVLFIPFHLYAWITIYRLRNMNRLLQICCLLLLLYYSGSAYIKLLQKNHTYYYDDLFDEPFIIQNNTQTYKVYV